MAERKFRHFCFLIQGGVTVRKKCFGNEIAPALVKKNGPLVRLFVWRAIHCKRSVEA